MDDRWYYHVLVICLCRCELGITGHGTLVVDDFPVARPDELDGLLGADSRTPRVAGRPEPVVLRGAGGPGAHAGVGCAVDRVGEDLVPEVDVVGDDGGGEVLVHPLAGVEHHRDLVVAVPGHHLERPKDLRRHAAEGLVVAEHHVQWDEDGRRLKAPVAVGDGVVYLWGKAAASEEHLYPLVQLQQARDVALDPLVRHGEHRTDG
mmetsp:Transcript_13451/g.33774  ORF Transcript_13451/g.33774 Transcript_13451/m.33774 type:complete len:205 (-) Transcript_13451:202-816(-)